MLRPTCRFSSSDERLLRRRRHEVVFVAVAFCCAGACDEDPSFTQRPNAADELGGSSGNAEQGASGSIQTGSGGRAEGVSAAGGTSSVGSEGFGGTGSELDGDGDGIPDETDTCPTVSDPEQRDFDGDRIGNLCDTDADGDGSTDPAPLEGMIERVDVLDFLIEDVCVDAWGNLVAEDPYDCREMGLFLRSSRLDEPILMVRHDRPDGSNPFGFQRTTSIPFRLTGGTVGVLHQFDFGWGGNRRAFLEFDRDGGFGALAPDAGSPIDGYDVLEHDGQKASYIGTCDPSGGVQPMFSWVNDVPGVCMSDDAWLVANTEEIAVDGTASSDMARLRIADVCPTDFLDDAYTTWSLRSFTFSSGKTMETLVSSHYGGESPEGADHIERFYYVRAYGRARWERWSKSGSPHSSPCTGPTTDGDFTRVDCRDWTFTEPAPHDGLEPRAWPVDARIATGNLLVNHDFGATTSYLGPWYRAEEDAVSRSILDEGGTGLQAHNRVLAMSWLGSGENYLYQDVDRGEIPSGSTLGFGARLWTWTGTGTATLSVSQYAGGELLSSTAINISATTTRRRFDSQLVVHPSATHFRFQVSLETEDAPFRLDDAWLTPM